MNTLTEEKIVTMIDVKMEKVKKEIMEEVEDLEEDVDCKFKKVDGRIDSILENLMSKHELKRMLQDVETIMKENAKQTASIIDLSTKLDGTLLADVTTTFLFFKTRLGRSIITGAMYILLLVVMFLFSVFSPTIANMITNNTGKFLLGNGIITIFLSAFAQRKGKGGENNG